MNSFLSSFLLAVVLGTTSLSAAVLPESDGSFKAELMNTKDKGNNKGGAGGVGSFFGPAGSGFGIPGLGNGGISGGYGSGYGGPGGGYSKGGVIRPTVVCKERGPCYKKKVTCPAKCFTSYSRSGRNYGAGGGGGRCTIDCKKKCIAYC
ncbi:keratin, type II cytoskeletal 2 epidermal-like [Telopea speciosissima]|uniref:keratin, type II cytoskeletal 2 epidermal-like n=1 Tax=Telopea speciosissima TaxID=54955 RepID=UPI001CC35ADE|nr:keratin, type II cytoskeletal 2 epidermal-like [Telopea speciosissima]